MIPSWSLLPYIPWIKNKNLEIDYTKLKAKSYFNTMKKKKRKKKKINLWLAFEALKELISRNVRDMLIQLKSRRNGAEPQKKQTWTILN